MTDEDDRIMLRAPRMVDLLPQLRQLDAEGWRVESMEKPVMEGDGTDVVVILVRGDIEDRIKRTPGLAEELDHSLHEPAASSGYTRKSRPRGPTVPIWLLDFDGVVNVGPLSTRPRRAQPNRRVQRWTEFASASVWSESAERAFLLRWSPEVISVIADAVAAGIDVRWLTTWREESAIFSTVIPGLPELPFLDEAILDPTVRDALDPRDRLRSGQWKADVAAAYVPDGVPLLWTDDSTELRDLTRRWRRARKEQGGPTVHIVPNEDDGLLPSDVETIRDFIRTFGTRGADGGR
ncbi:hypothetical protein [Tsukamurella paurometabola]|uniref:Uncharacterized protein n=1 Tax=Tsukamurella paurometabola TaxID=2061 RepID=A0ABS5NEQ7_TSUPA|nr:hypothetical protein [Tsukamurella paurometabola]MBS4102781.1 hypothetical protein [Tsukamurella paurometabola]